MRANGVADNGATLRSVLSIFDSNFNLVGTGTEDASTLLATYSSMLGAGKYFAEISSFGGHNEVATGFDAAQYYDIGGYFLTGSGFLTAVPEPGSFVFLMISGVAIASRRRRFIA